MQAYEQRRLSVPCSFKNVRRISSFAKSACEGLMPEDDAALVELAIAEAANNIVEHSYRDSQGWPIEICARFFDGRLEFLLADSGLPFNPGHVEEPSFDWASIEDVPEHGRGLFLINTIMDKVKFFHAGEANICFLSKKIKATLGSSIHDDDNAKEQMPFVCDCADPFMMTMTTRESQKSDDNPSTPMGKALIEICGALSLQTDQDSAFNKLAEAMRLNSSANGCSIRLKNQGMLEISGRDGEIGDKVGPIPLESTDLEAQTAALCYETASDYGPNGFRLCVPLTGIGKLLGVATLFFKSKQELELAKEKSQRELSNIVSIAIENQTLYAKALGAERSRKEMEIAANLHKGVVSMLVPNMSGLQIYAKSQSALEVGGDYLSFHKASDHVLWFMICDAMGKGMSASFFSILSHMTFQSILFIQDNLEPGELLTMGNRILSRDFDRFEMFMTSLVGKIDLKTHVLQYASAGHCPPIIYHPRAGISLLDTEDFMLGVDSDTQYKTFSVPFRKGMRLVAYTDGLTDIVGEDGEMVGVEPLVEFCDRQFKSNDVTKSCERIFSDAIKASKGKLQDDITLIGIESV